MQTEIYEELEARGVTLARAAASGDLEAEGKLVETLGELTRAPYHNEGWPRSGSVAYAVFDAFLQVDDGDREALRRLVGPFVEALMAHPDHLGVPYRFEPAEMLGPSAIPLLARLLARGLAATSRAAIEGLDYVNPLNDAGFRLATDALVGLFTYEEEAVEAVATAVAALEWNDERLWLLFRVLAAHAVTGVAALGEVARVVLVRLATATTGITGPGADKLRGLLLRAKIIPKALAPGVKPATLPRKLPLTVAEALALGETWGLSPAEVQAGRPAKAKELDVLADRLGRRLPKELTLLLGTHASLGARDIGPPARMRQLLREMAETIEDDEEEADDEVPSGRGQYDVRGFDPLKKAIPLGSDPSGDLYFLATGAKSGAETAPVIRYRHDQALVATIVADSLGEFVALILARVYARREGLGPELDKLDSRRRTITSGYKKPKPPRE
ncbi:SMI1/KNR4 family protein [Nannocystis radixulma]|uniref:SMI1/KNR4 family protein n=1 Tax=Nannocystis radixulma TaxID=2995305 RepID=A0ABT5BK38_9BACT|nr:SMI1/KNR4 family protein [Nannocystis radixulma]MDC0674524.1 SMI1/KNR4 family protein [Nannocystis radixulma]